MNFPKKKNKKKTLESEATIPCIRTTILPVNVVGRDNVQ